MIFLDALHGLEEIGCQEAGEVLEPLHDIDVERNECVVVRGAMC